MLWLVAVAGVLGCASEVIPTYGDPAQVAGGVGGGGGAVTTGNAGGASSSSSTTSTCEVNTACEVSFLTDVFPVLDRGGAQGCAVTTGSPLNCHSDGAGNLTLTVGDAAGHRDALLAYMLDGLPYIVPCDPDASEIFCNLKVSDGDDPSPSCGTTMPLVEANAPTEAELQAIKDWIACGAPDN